MIALDLVSVGLRSQALALRLGNANIHVLTLAFLLSDISYMAAQHKAVVHQIALHQHSTLSSTNIEVCSIRTPIIPPHP